MSFDFNITVNFLHPYLCHVCCVLNVLRASWKIGECSLDLPSLNIDIIISIFINQHVFNMCGFTLIQHGLNVCGLLYLSSMTL